MSFAMTDAQVRDHMRDVKDQVARCRGRSPQPGQVHGATGRPDPRHPSARLARLARLPRLRSRVGLRLVEAGLHLLADGPQPRG
jgi:hypothetical protein